MHFTLFGVSLVFPFRLGKPSWVGMDSLWGKNARDFGERVLFAFFEQFGRQGIKSPLKMCGHPMAKNFFF